MDEPTTGMDPLSRQ